MLLQLQQDHAYLQASPIFKSKLSEKCCLCISCWAGAFSIKWLQSSSLGSLLAIR